MSLLQIHGASIPSFDNYGSPIVMVVMTVLTVGARGTDHAAYRAVVPDTSLRLNHEALWAQYGDWVYSNGQKLTKTEAMTIWPHLKEKEYRI